MLKILGKSISINVRKVLWTCHELGLDYTHEEYGGDFTSTQTPEFKALNPNSLVPVIIDGDFVLWESNAICRYLVAKAGRQDLLPEDPQSRAKVEQWMDWQLGDLNNAWRYAFMSLARHSPQHTDPDLLANSISEWNRLMEIVEQQLQEKGDYILGDSFTLADVVIGMSVNRWVMTPMTRPTLSAVFSYYERLNQREGFKLFGRNGNV
ncbi:glutathione S-transferase [Rouxiella silvae]|uniref:Glutathione S-transferase n=1 Tax=Rouxiella silvae TaxID=1646373 RepID=A0AA40X697_9GAMM|nr:glutathione S-transferase [Rouxiella silvae]KQN49176.1 glutathione S-transferase [Serratia sp. Leaf50]MBF6639455.1 glutathione S-transferase [Rouxiella silvae]ORJ20766.1 glutathione S-transferase [Rouxiella silvae]